MVNEILKAVASLFPSPLTPGQWAAQMEPVFAEARVERLAKAGLTGVVSPAEADDYFATCEQIAASVESEEAAAMRYFKSIRPPNVQVAK